MFVRKDGAKLHDVHRCGIVVRSGETEQYDLLLLVVLAADRCGVFEIVPKCLHIVGIDEKPVRNFVVVAVQIAFLHNVDGRNRLALLFGNAAEYRVPQAPIHPIIPEGRIGFLPARQLLQVHIGVEVVVRIALLYLAELGIHLAVIVDIVREQVCAYRAVFDGQRAVIEGLVVVLYVLVQRIALHAAYGHDVRIRIVLLDVVHLEQVIQRVRRHMEIIVAEVPAPFCDHHSATAVTGLLSERQY